MKIETKEDYLKGQEIIAEVEKELLESDGVFKQIRILFGNINYITSFDCDAANELIESLPSDIRDFYYTLYSKNFWSDNLAENLMQLKKIKEFDPDRAEIIKKKSEKQFDLLLKK